VKPTLLAGIRLVDLSMGWAGPLAARTLADLGADVVKVESCVRFDWWRGWEATREWIDADGAERSAAFNMVNRNKRGIALDLSNPRGATLLKRLIGTADAVVENYSAGVLPGLGLDFESLKTVHPELVMLSMPAFGDSGPWRGYRAYGSTIEQASGLPHLSGEPDWPPTMIHVALGDAIAGLNGAAALLTALRHQRRAGAGQRLDLSQSECLFPHAIDGLLEQAGNGRVPVRMGSRHPRHAPHGVYPGLGTDQWIVIQVTREAEWQALAAEFPGRLDSFGDERARKAREAELDAALAGCTRACNSEVLANRLQARGVIAAVARNALDARHDPQLAARGYYQLLERAFVGTIANPSAPFRDSAAPYPIERPAPTLGQHNREILGGLLGLTDGELESLHAAGIIGTRPRLRD
jgi:crotonobetainyl-CoA:carnitine CoA-transferase CaiB-like acyl-CoA transferase